MWRIILSAVFSLILPGIGQFINGQRWKGIIILFLTLLGTALKGIVTIIPLTLIYIWALIDALIVSYQIYQGNKEGPTFKAQWLEVLIALVIAVPLSFLANEFSKERVVVALPEEETKIKQDEEKVKQEAIQYLEEKYNDEFAIKDVSYTWKTETYYMKASSKTRPEITFSVRKTKNKPFIDTYLVSIWSEQAEEEMGSLLRPIYPKFMTYTVTARFDKDTAREVTGKEIPSYKELRKTTDKGSQTLKIFVIQNITERNKEEQIDKIFEIITYLNENNINSSLLIEFYDEKLLTTGVEEIPFSGRLEYVDSLHHVVDINEVSSIKSKEDVAAVLKKL